MMENHNEHIDHLFKAGLDNYSEMPPASVWDDLEKRLDKKKNKKGFFFRWLAMSLLFVSIIAAGISYYAKVSTHSATPINVIAAKAPTEITTTTSNSQTKNIDNQSTKEKTKKQIATPAHSNTNNTITDTKATTTETKTTEVVTKTSAPLAENNVSKEENSIDNQSVKREANSKIAALKPKRKYLPVNINNYNAAPAIIPQTITPTTIDPIPVAKVPETIPATKQKDGHIASLKPKRKYIAANSTATSAIIPHSVSPTTVNQLPKAEVEVGAPTPVIEEPAIVTTHTIQKDNTKVAPIATYQQQPTAVTKEPIASFTAKEVNKVPAQVWEEPIPIAAIPTTSNISPVHTTTPNIWASRIKVTNNINTDKIIDNQDNKSINNNAVKAAATKVEAPMTPDMPIAAASFSAFQIGVKAGYETGASQKLAITPYLFYQVAPRLSLMVQPGLKFAKAPTQKLNGSQSFYKVNSGGNVYETDSSVLIIIGNPMDTFLQRNYSYTQTHDSVAKTYSAGGTYVELELPILLRYAITSKFSVYGGMNIIYGKTIGVHEETYTSGPITQTGTSSTFAQIHAPAPTPDNISNVIKYTGNPLSSYTGPLYPSFAENMFRMGYMLGCSYEWKKRWLVDATLQQTFAKRNMVGGYDINKPLSAMYIRFTIGYILIK